MPAFADSVLKKMARGASGGRAPAAVKARGKRTGSDATETSERTDEEASGGSASDTEPDDAVIAETDTPAAAACAPAADVAAAGENSCRSSDSVSFACSVLS